MIKDRLELTTPKDILTATSGPWTGGFFDVRGTVDIGLRVATYKENIYFNMVPRVTLFDKDPRNLQMMQILYGGKIANNKWSLGGSKMLELVRKASKFMPSRKPAVEKILEWSVEPERAIGLFFTEKALALEKERRFDDLDGCYDSIVLFRGFTAGVVDALAGFRTKKKKNESKTYIHLEIDSSNLSLLNALKNKFGGSIEIVPKGTKGNIKGKEFTTKRDSGKWELAHYDAIELLEFVGPFIILKKDIIIRCLNETGIDPSTILGYNSGIQKKGR